jgi:hypothetical protein
LEEGFTLDRGHHNQNTQATWVEGKPARSFWTGVASRNRVKRKITTYRCSRCGFLESYAPTE